MEDIMEEVPDLLKPVEKENPMKEWLVNYVGEMFKPENDEVNVEMIIQAMAKEFPEFILALAEENFIRGYQQALNDVDSASKIEKENTNA
tara:strand:- start:288 stop:557 length:270 start_codon:yes stop_codon:yes gene_type:complete